MIRFGTSGWRGIIADDFTFDNLRLVTQAICEYIKKQDATSKNKINNKSLNPHCIVIGYDTRFLSENFAQASAEVVAGNGIKALYCRRPTPTPVISYEIIKRKTSGAINITASHNPPEYNGIKFSPSWGGPALPQTTQFIEKCCSELSKDSIKSISIEEAKRKRLFELIDSQKIYISRIKELINFKDIKKSNLKIALDMFYGTSIGYLDEILKDVGIKFHVIHNYRDILFGRKTPEPSEENLVSLKDILKKESCHIGLATDGDADRFGILDSEGRFINPNQVITLLLYYLAKYRKWRGIVARSVMTTHWIDKVAEKFGIEVKETPVGFKYIGEIMLKEGDRFIIGGEESGGLTIRNHVPEKDGILACLLVAEMISVTRKPISKILEDITNLVGPVFSHRTNLHLTVTEVENLKKILNNNPPKSFAGIKVKDTITIDGYKFILMDGSWLGIRLSGTEPVVRIYVETYKMQMLKKLLKIGEDFVRGKY